MDIVLCEKCQVIFIEHSRKKYILEFVDGAQYLMILHNPFEENTIIY